MSQLFRRQSLILNPLSKFLLAYLDLSFETGSRPFFKDSYPYVCEKDEKYSGV